MNTNGTKIEFHDIYKTFYHKIYRYLARFVDNNEAEDLTQEVFVKLNRALNGFKGESKLSTWIYRIATNVALDRLRSLSFKNLQRIASISESEMEIGDVDIWSEEKEVQIDKQFIREEMNQCIRNFIYKLPNGYKEPLILNEYEGLSNKEIAAVLQVTVETVKIRLYRAKVKLRKELENHCNFYRDERNELACDKKIVLT